MDLVNQILNSFILFKAAFLILNLILIVFLLVVLQQVFAMSSVITDAFDSGIIRTVAIALLVISVSLFLTALVIL